MVLRLPPDQSKDLSLLSYAENAMPADDYCTVCVLARANARQCMNFASSHNLLVVKKRTLTDNKPHCHHAAAQVCSRFMSACT